MFMMPVTNFMNSRMNTMSYHLLLWGRLRVGVCLCLSLRLSRHSALPVTSVPSGRFAALIRRDLAYRMVIATHLPVMSSISRPSCASANAL